MNHEFIRPEGFCGEGRVFRPYIFNIQLKAGFINIQ